MILWLKGVEMKFYKGNPYRWILSRKAVGATNYGLIIEYQIFCVLTNQFFFTHEIVPFKKFKGERGNK